MKIMIKKCALMLIAVSLLTSCTKLLNQKPVSNISNNSFWTTPDDATAGLYGMYVRLRAEARTNLYYYGEARSESMGRSVGEVGRAGKYVDNRLTPVNIDIDWKNLYSIIHDANLILSRVPGIPFGSEAEKKHILAQAYAMRAYVYFILARTWGDVPIVIVPTETVAAGEIFKSKSPVMDVFTLIKQDIELALSLFNSDDYPQGRSFWSKPATQTLKADVFLWTAKVLGGGTEDIRTSLNAAQAVLSTDLELLPNYDDIFRYENKGNKEIVMAIRFFENESTENYYQDMYVFPAYLPSNIDEDTKEAIGLGGGYSLWTASAAVREQFNEEDVRKFASFREMYTYPTGNEGGDKSYYGSVISKFRGIIINGRRMFLDDIIIYRYADVLLMIAEAKNALGEDPSLEINLLRIRAYGEHFEDHMFLAGDRTFNDEALLKERLFEFSFEGKRWWDLVRFGKAFELVPSLQSRADQKHLLLFPIPETTLSLNPSLEQNLGY